MQPIPARTQQTLVVTPVSLNIKVADSGLGVAESLKSTALVTALGLFGLGVVFVTVVQEFDRTSASHRVGAASDVRSRAKTTSLDQTVVAEVRGRTG